MRRYSFRFSVAALAVLLSSAAASVAQENAGPGATPPAATGQIVPSGQPRQSIERGPEPSAPNAAIDRADALADAALAAPGAPPPAKATKFEVPKLPILDLILGGGVIMIPIFLMSFMVVLFAVERFLALRRRRVIPPRLVRGLKDMATRPGGLDPKAAYKLCQEYPSAAARVVSAMLMKVGRPHAEVEAAVRDASEHEASKLYRNVRPINLATTVSPLLGLLGTVQGMIQCFFITAHLPPNVNKAQSLADGIYVALVTTFAGLSVAIPGAMLSHYFEGRIQSHFREIHELVYALLPQLQRYEGKVRLADGPNLVDSGKAGDVEPPPRVRTTAASHG